MYVCWVGSGDSAVCNIYCDASGNHTYNVASGVSSTVSGGWKNTASGQYSTIGGGKSCIASDLAATVAGGQGNSALAVDATIGGGYQNTCFGKHGTVAGGSKNHIEPDAQYATVGGGYKNFAFAKHSVVPGGYNNRVMGTVGFGAGKQAVVTHNHSAVFSMQRSGTCYSGADQTFTICAPGGFVVNDVDIGVVVNDNQKVLATAIDAIAAIADEVSIEQVYVNQLLAVIGQANSSVFDDSAQHLDDIDIPVDGSCSDPVARGLIAFVIVILLLCHVATFYVKYVSARC